MSHICANAIKSMEEGWNGDLEFVGLYSVIIYIECVYVGLECLCKPAVSVCICAAMCIHGHKLETQNIFINRKKKQKNLFSYPCHLHPIYLLVSWCVSGSFRQEMVLVDSSAWWGSKANASGKI